MKVKNNDFVEIEYDLYANDKLVQTTDEKKGKEAKVPAKEFKPLTIIVGKEFLLKAVDEALVKSADVSKEQTLDLKTEEAYGKRRKDLLKVLPKSAFDEHQTRPVVGMMYDFNGMYGTVKSIVGGRVMVDFNNPLAGKAIKVSFKVVKKVEDVKEKVDFVFEKILNVPKNMFESSLKEKNLVLSVPAQLAPIKDMITKTLGEYMDLKGYKVDVKVSDKFNPKK